jgi:DNA-3-methyladenine glycosylase II
MTTGYWQAACDHLSAHDPIMEQLIKRFTGSELQSASNFFRTIANAIVGQQISVKAADSIWKRLINSCGTEEFSPQLYLGLSDEQLRAAGLSVRKVGYLRDLACAVLDSRIDTLTWDSLSDDEIRSLLCSLRGVGPWTADMILVFYLNRPDVLPLGDIALLRAAAQQYGWPNDGQLVQKLRQYAEIWRPWRTVASWYLWRTQDSEAVQY